MIKMINGMHRLHRLRSRPCQVTPAKVKKIAQKPSSVQKVPAYVPQSKMKRQTHHSQSEFFKVAMSQQSLATKPYFVCIYAYPAYPKPSKSIQLTSL